MPPASAAGYWGPITANYDWCEENYKYTPYVAEFFNTLTSFSVALAGVLFTRLSVRHQYGVSFLLAGIGLAVVGIGSIAFHGTLLREGQVCGFAKKQNFNPNPTPNPTPNLRCSTRFRCSGAR